MRRFCHAPDPGVPHLRLHCPSFFRCDLHFWTGALYNHVTRSSRHCTDSFRFSGTQLIAWHKGLSDALLHWTRTDMCITACSSVRFGNLPKKCKLMSWVNIHIHIPTHIHKLVGCGTFTFTNNRLSASLPKQNYQSWSTNYTS